MKKYIATINNMKNIFVLAEENFFWISNNKIF